MDFRTLDSVESIRAVAPAWDSLWQRSGVTMPTARAELVAQWLEHFAPGAATQALVVEQDGEFLAALPITGRRVRRLITVGDVTWNEWSPSGELLLDPHCDAEAVLGRLLDGLTNLDWPLLWLDLAPIDAPWWRSFLNALARRQRSADVHPRYRIGQVELSGDFDAYFSSRSKNLRRNLRRDARRIEDAGGTTFDWRCEFDAEEIERELRRVFEVEDRSWKQSHGQTVLQMPGMFEFYCRQARQLAEWGMLRIATLEVRGQPIAFEMGWTAKRVYHSFKVGFDAAYRDYGPGHLLRRAIVERLYQSSDADTIDFQGPMTEALAAWSTRSYPIGRIVLAADGLAGRLALAGYRGMSRLMRRVRQSGRSDSPDS